MPLRVLKIQSGSIRMDGVNTRDVDPHILRRRLAIISQGPIQFTDTLRFSLDTTREHTDKELLEALTKIGLLDSSDASRSSVAVDQKVPQSSTEY